MYSDCVLRILEAIKKASGVGPKAYFFYSAEEEGVLFILQRPRYQFFTCFLERWNLIGTRFSIKMNFIEIP
jgi:hypothetical protein